MGTPQYNIVAERQLNNQLVTSDLHRSPSWCVAIVRYKTPATAYARNNELLETKPLLILYNDCIAINIVNNKNNYIKSCNITLKSGEEYYLNAVAPGDWVFVWIHNYDEHIQNIISHLQAINKAPSGVFNNWDSGLKFVGRITNISTSDTITPQGIRRIDQTILAESFIELSSSVYYTQIASDQLMGKLTMANSDSSTTQTSGNSTLSLALLTESGIESALGKGLGKKFQNFFAPQGEIVMYPKPDQAIAFYLIIAMGIKIDFAMQILNKDSKIAEGIISRAIKIPPIVAKIMGKPNATYLWQLYNIYLGIQKYPAKGANVWEQFSPQSSVFRVTSLKEGEGEVFFKSPHRLKGWVPFFPTPWDNKTLWGILNEYLNPIVNELYTSLRINKYNRISLSITAREYPFGTQLYNRLSLHKILNSSEDYEHSKKMIQQSTQKKQSQSRKAAFGQSNHPTSDLSKFLEEVRSSNQTKIQTSTFGLSEEELRQLAAGKTPKIVRTHYKEIPRWIIDESLVLSVNLTTSESQRCNFVIVWGSNQFSYIAQPLQDASQTGGINSNNSIEVYKMFQMAAGNMIMDRADMQRHGLRAVAAETPFDFPLAPITYCGVFAKLIADWMFNGHLRPYGTVVLTGLHEPIVEGDNIELRGIVFHIERVEHRAMINNGVKTFITILSISRGILAWSLDSPNSTLPLYPIDEISTLKDLLYTPGTTQNTPYETSSVPTTISNPPLRELSDYNAFGAKKFIG